MKLLEQRIAREGKILPGNIVKVDGFLNHRVDTVLLREMAREFKAHFGGKAIDLIMTCEASGIAIATVAAEEFGVPMLFVKKAKSSNLGGDVFTSEIQSYTYGKTVTLTCSKNWLHEGDRVLIIDDFLADGEALSGLIDICGKADATVVGAGICIEKAFQPGGKKIRSMGINLHSLAVADLDADGSLIIHGEDE